MLSYQYGIIDLDKIQGSKKHLFEDLSTGRFRQKYADNRPILILDKTDNSLVKVVHGSEARGTLCNYMLFQKDINLAVPLLVEDRKVSDTETIYEKYKDYFQLQRPSDTDAIGTHINHIFTEESYGVLKDIKKSIQSNNKFVEDFKSLIEEHCYNQDKKPLMKIQEIRIDSGNEYTNFLRVKLKDDGIILYILENQMLIKSINSDVIIIHDFEHDVESDTIVEFLASSLDVLKSIIEKFLLGN
ncbi:hypothetical protein COF68_06110 [Bacillus toyonensis]|uniref:hypothetical protein n=1 Tax=Bacillus toyonensis TaxID=155322 RepID=UPI000BFDFD3A|nr:hypothetical protein [Bacillus toyonensis]PHE64408.1 hypothetical protein COF68_06110 [Bacillus toyonensis]